MQTALTIAGSDPSGGAGIQADLKTFTVLGVFGMSAITAVTVQNTVGVTNVLELPPDLVRQQIDAVAGDIRIDACKTGMLAGVPIIEAVAAAIGYHRLLRYVCDPVMVAKSGDVLLRPDAIDAVRRHLFPLADLLTPNRREAALLAGRPPDDVRTLDRARDVARELVDAGTRAVVVKGIADHDRMVDVFYDGTTFQEHAAPVLPAGRNHGSGCTFSAAVTAMLARGASLGEAVAAARQVVQEAIASAAPMGRGTRPVNVLAARIQVT